MSRLIFHFVSGEEIEVEGTLTGLSSQLADREAEGLPSTWVRYRDQVIRLDNVTHVRELPDR